MEARVRALLADGDDADGCYQESIGYLARTRLRAQQARGHPLCGEWLRRQLVGQGVTQGPGQG